MPIVLPIVLLLPIALPIVLPIVLPIELPIELHIELPYWAAVLFGLFTLRLAPGVVSKKSMSFLPPSHLETH